MPAKPTVSDLRNGIQKIYHEVMREREDGEISNEDILQMVKERHADDLRELTPKLLNMALTKLLNDVSGRKVKRENSPQGFDLFGNFRIPSLIAISRGKKKSPLSFSFLELELYVKNHVQKSASDRNEQLKLLLDEVRPHLKSKEDTLEILIKRMNETNKI